MVTTYDRRVQVQCLDDPVRLYHFREGDHEVDLVIETVDGRVFGIEVKLSSNPGPQDVRGLNRLARSTGSRYAGGIVLARVPAARGLSGTHVAPLESVWA